jgi:hypothetical protein
MWGSEKLGIDRAAPLVRQVAYVMDTCVVVWHAGLTHSHGLLVVAGWPLRWSQCELLVSFFVRTEGLDWPPCMLQHRARSKGDCANSVGL